MKPMKRALILTAVIGLGMSAIYMLPPFKEAPSALNTSIPEKLGPAVTSGYAPSQKELDILAKDTEFSKAACFYPRIEERSYITGETPHDRLDLSIVLSGSDLANSIHRPERCLEAQGHRIQSSSQSEVTLDNGQVVPLTMLITKLTMETGPEDDKKVISVDNLNCYFFVGRNQLTNSHTERSIIDIKDRVLAGKAQRWAFVTISMRFVDGEKTGERGAPPNREMAEDRIRELAKELAERNIDWELVKG